MSISLCQMDHVWYIHLKETVVAASECSIEELRPRQSPVPAYLLTTSLSPGSCGVLVISAGPAHPAPAVSPRPAHVTVSRPGN